MSTMPYTAVLHDHFTSFSEDRSNGPSTVQQTVAELTEGLLEKLNTNLFTDEPVDPSAVSTSLYPANLSPERDMSTIPSMAVLVKPKDLGKVPRSFNSMQEVEHHDTSVNQLSLTVLKLENTIKDLKAKQEEDAKQLAMVLAALKDEKKERIAAVDKEKKERVAAVKKVEKERIAAMEKAKEGIAAVEKERKERIAEVEKERQDKEELKAQLARQQADIDEQSFTLLKLTRQMVPIILRAFLDLVRQHIARICDQSWEALCSPARSNDKRVQKEQEIVRITQELRARKVKLSDRAIRLLYGSNYLRANGNEEAHKASFSDIRGAVLSTIGVDRDALEDLFFFLFRIKV